MKRLDAMKRSKAATIIQSAFRAARRGAKPPSSSQNRVSFRQLFDSAISFYCKQIKDKRIEQVIIHPNAKYDLNFRRKKAKERQKKLGNVLNVEVLCLGDLRLYRG